MEANDPIYRAAFVMGLLGGSVMMILLAAALAFFGLCGPTLPEPGSSLGVQLAGGHFMWRIALGWGMLWVVLQAIQTAGGGVVGVWVTRGAMLMAYFGMLAASVLPEIWAELFGSGSAWRSMSNAVVLVNIGLVLVPHGISTVLAGWLHGD